MTAAFIGILLGVLTVSFIGILSARAAKRQGATRATLGPSQQTSIERNEKKATPNAMELAAVGTGQANGSAKSKRDRMSSSGAN